MGRVLSLVDSERVAELLVSGLTCSEHGLTAGGRRSYFVNVDTVIENPERAEALVGLAAEAIATFRKAKRVDRLALVDVSSRGPIGLVQCRTALSVATDLPTVVIRPDKRLHVSQVDGALESDDGLLFLCDVLTTGQTLARAIGVCCRRQARVVGSLFLYDGLAGGEANLERIGMTADSCTNLEILKTKASTSQVGALGMDIDLGSRDLFDSLSAQL